MRGTGSQDFVVTDTFVPTSHTSFLGEAPSETGPLYNPRLVLAFAFLPIVANSCGIARGAIDSFIELASRESSTQSGIILRDRAFVQSRLAEAEAILNSARAYIVQTVGTLWEANCRSDDNISQALAQVRLAIVHGMHEAVRPVDLVFHAAGTNAIYSRNPLERYFRDIHVTAQHSTAFPAQFEAAGKALMGLRPADPGW
jgi:alkylation response protein AidB-like acyl-CoA dehydrogenase